MSGCRGVLRRPRDQYHHYRYHHTRSHYRLIIKRNFRVIKEVGVEKHDGDVIL